MSAWTVGGLSCRNARGSQGGRGFRGLAVRPIPALGADGQSRSVLQIGCRALRIWLVSTFTISGIQKEAACCQSMFCRPPPMFQFRKPAGSLAEKFSVDIPKVVRPSTASSRRYASAVWLQGGSLSGSTPGLRQGGEQGRSQGDLGGRRAAYH